MLIAAYYFIVNVVIPQIGAYASALLEPVMVITITLAGLVMIFGAVGIRISNNLGSTVVNGIFRAIGYVGRSLFQGIAWVIRSVFNLLPRVFVESRRVFSQMGLNTTLSNLFAVLVTVLVLAIII